MSKGLKTGLKNSWDPLRLKSSREDYPGDDYPGPSSLSRNPPGFLTEEP